MIETLIVSLVLAAISGLTFVAYKHPDGYQNIAGPVCKYGLVIVLIMLAVNATGIWWGVGSIAETSKDYPNQTLKETAYTIQVMVESRDLIKKIIVVTIPSLVYLVFLWNLPTVLGIKKDQDK